MRFGIALLAACAVLPLAACGTAPGRPATAGHGSASQASRGVTPSRPSVAPVTPTCGPAPPRHAWAVELTPDGRTAWQTALATRDVSFTPSVPPLLAGSVAVLAQDGIVHGLDLATGRPLWSWAGGQAVYGMWRPGGLVAVLTDQVSDHSRLTGLDAATGAVRWSLRLPARGLLGGHAATAHGGLAMAVIGQGLQVVDLAGGRVRWRVRAPAAPGLAAAGGVVIYGVNGRLTGYDDRTGQPRWTITQGVPPGTTVQVAGGLALVGSDEQGPGIPTVLTAVVPATGRVAWRFDPGPPVTVLAAGPAGLALATYDPRRLYLVDPRTGRVRWHVDTAASMDILPLVTSTAVVGAEGFDTTTITDRDAASGLLRWQVRPAGLPVGGVAILQVGQLALVPGAPVSAGRPARLSAYRLAGGGLAWRASVPAFVQVPLVPVPGGVLVQPADLVYACAVAG